jgi:hypothetical protein
MITTVVYEGFSADLEAAKPDHQNGGMPMKENK